MAAVFASSCCAGYLRQGIEKKNAISERGPSGVPKFPARTAEEGSPVDKARALRLDILESQLKDLKASWSFGSAILMRPRRSIRWPATRGAAS